MSPKVGVNRKQTQAKISKIIVRMEKDLTTLKELQADIINLDKAEADAKRATKRIK